MRQRRAFFHYNRSLHAEATMIGNTVQRNAKRAFVRLAAWITFETPYSQEHVAFVRDISPRGIFFYSDLRLLNGEPVEFVLQYLSGNSRVRIHLKGTVVRVEQAGPSSAIGIAVAFDVAHDELPQSPVRMVH
jgi:hypothetical protein